MAITWSLPEPDTDSGFPDLHLTAEGNLALADGDDSVQQRVLQRLRFWRGESFLYNERGIPYIDDLLERPISIGLISVVLTEEVLDVDGVAEVTDVEATINPATRRMQWQCRVKTETGGTFPVEITVGDTI